MAEGPSAGAAQSLRTAQANIKRARDEVEEMLGHLDTARQVSAALCGTHTLMARCSHQQTAQEIMQGHRVLWCLLRSVMGRWEDMRCHVSHCAASFGRCTKLRH